MAVQPERPPSNETPSGRASVVTEAGRPYSVTILERYFRLAKRLAGIDRRLRFHDLRHSFASDLASAGVGLQIIQKALGHSTPAMTIRYAKPSEGCASQRASASRPAGERL